MNNMFNRAIARIKLGMFIRNYDHDPALDDIIDYILDYEDNNGGEISIDISQYDITIKSHLFVFTAWNANKYYAWLQTGTFQQKGETYSWDNMMPSAYRMWELKCMIDRIRRNKLWTK